MSDCSHQDVEYLYIAYPIFFIYCFDCGKLLLCDNDKNKCKTLSWEPIIKILKERYLK